MTAIEVASKTDKAARLVDRNMLKISRECIQREAKVNNWAIWLNKFFWK